ncbi:MAG TPA: DUF1801 domain-containing protein [Spirochaetia bacterium]|nr:DUF1801 domain-containing protein [Spirochaetia bacterium]
MTGTATQSVDQYIANHTDDVQAVLQQVRSAIRKALPDAEELISYGIPAYKMSEGPLLWFAAWKRHYSLYPATGLLTQEFTEELAPYKVNKGTIRFPLSQPVPVTLIARIAKFRAKETAGKKAAHRDTKR